MRWIWRSCRLTLHDSPDMRSFPWHVLTTDHDHDLPGHFSVFAAYADRFGKVASHRLTHFCLLLFCSMFIDWREKSNAPHCIILADLTGVPSATTPYSSTTLRCLNCPMIAASWRNFERSCREELSFRVLAAAWRAPAAVCCTEPDKMATHWCLLGHQCRTRWLNVWRMQLRGASCDRKKFSFFINIMFWQGHTDRSNRKSESLSQFAVCFHFAEKVLCNWPKCPDYIF